MRLIEKRGDFLTILNSLKKSALLDNENQSLRERKALQILAFDQLEKAIKSKTSVLFN